MGSTKSTAANSSTGPAAVDVVGMHPALQESELSCSREAGAGSIHGQMLPSATLPNMLFEINLSELVDSKNGRNALEQRTTRLYE